MKKFYAKYVFGANAVKANLDSIMATVNKDIYAYMWGPSEFMVTGTLKGSDGAEILKEIIVPTLFTAGEFDEILPDIVWEKAALVEESYTNLNIKSLYKCI